MVNEAPHEHPLIRKIVNSQALFFNKWLKNQGCNLYLICHWVIDDSESSSDQFCVVINGRSFQVFQGRFINDYFSSIALKRKIVFVDRTVLQIKSVLKSRTATPFHLRIKMNFRPTFLKKIYKKIQPYGDTKKLGFVVLANVLHSFHA